MLLIMDKLIKCKLCGCRNFWYFGKYVKCQECLTKIRETIPVLNEELKNLWVMKFSKKLNSYLKWELTIFK